MFDRVYRQKKQERKAAHEGASSVQDKLRDLVNAHEEGLIDDDEFEAAKAKVLGQI